MQDAARAQDAAFAQVPNRSAPTAAEAPAARPPAPPAHERAPSPAIRQPPHLLEAGLHPRSDAYTAAHPGAVSPPPDRLQAAPTAPHLSNGRSRPGAGPDAVE